MWKLFVHLLVVTVLPLWWWMWRVEGLVLLLPVVILTSLLGKLHLIIWWHSSLQGVDLINDCSNGTFHSLKSYVGGLLLLHE
jgi:hypothetical protein